MDFNVAEYEMLIDMVPDSKLQLSFKKLPFVEFWFSNKEEYSQLSEKIIKFFLFSNYIIRVFSIYFNQNNILQEMECRSRQRISH